MEGEREREREREGERERESWREYQEMQINQMLLKCGF